MPVLESKLERDSIAYAESIGYISFKISPISQRGWPDRVFINKHGRHVYIEMKASKKKLRNLQVYRIQQLRDRGCSVFWADNLDKVKKILDEHILEPS